VRAAGGPERAKPVANWITTELLREVSGEAGVGEHRIGPARLGELVALIEDGTISGKIGKQVFALMLESDDPPAAIVEREGLVQISDEAAVAAVVDEVIAAHPGQLAAYRAGKTKLLGFFVGQVMKATRGQANPAVLNRLLAERLAPGS
jgi:Asp-tRNA(Asn)/Glu-tRNA(Gln) amidotransferase B subunit